MRRGSATLHTITPGIDLTDARVFLTYTQNGKTVLELTSDDALFVGQDTIEADISQDASLLFAPNVVVKAQLRWIFEDGTAGASNIFTFNVEDVLNAKMIYFGEDPTLQFSVSPESVSNIALVEVSKTPANAYVAFTSSNTEAFTVSNVTHGTDSSTCSITAVGEAGSTAVITATLEDYPEVSISYTVTVSDK